MKILITGGSGLVGSRLTNHLINQGHDVRILSRKRFRHLHASVFEWNPSDNYIEDGALHGVDAVVNLAGAGVADRPWTEQRKKALLRSRVDSANCLFHHLQLLDDRPAVVVNASAMGIYGYGGEEEVFTEMSPNGQDFLAKVCVEWERAALQFSTLSTRLVLLRIGMVLDDKGGALKKMARPIKFCVGSPLGSGDQMISWIHVEDMYRMIEFAMFNSALHGAYNAVSSHHVSNKEFTKTLASVLKRPIMLPHVPEFLLKLLLGEMSDIVLKGSVVSNQKIIESGFQFKFDKLEGALKDLL